MLTRQFDDLTRFRGTIPRVEVFRYDNNVVRYDGVRVCVMLAVPYPARRSVNLVTFTSHVSSSVVRYFLRAVAVASPLADDDGIIAAWQQPHVNMPRAVGTPGQLREEMKLRAVVIRPGVNRFMLCESTIVVD